MFVPASGQTTTVPAVTDWLAVAKTGALIVAFLGCTADIVLGHATPDVTSLAWALGGTLGLLQIANVGANIANVRAFLAKPGSGVVPQAIGTPLVTVTNGHGLTPTDPTGTTQGS